MPGLNATDRLLVGYTLGVALLTAIAGRDNRSQLALAGLHVTIAGFAVVTLVCGVLAILSGVIGWLFTGGSAEA